MSSNSLSHNENPREIDNTPSTSQALKKLESSKRISTTSVNDERTCWICFATDEENRLATWVKPCKCRGTMQWVHQTCLYRWIDEKQRGNFGTKAVICPQCQFEYLIVSPSMGKLANVLEACDFFIKRMSPFLAAGIFISSLYWSAVTYGAVTYMQVFGHEKGLEMLEDSDIITLLIGLPSIPVSLVLGRMIQWENAIITLMRNRRSIMRKLPLLKFLLSCPEQEEETSPPTYTPNLPPYMEPVSGTRVFCGALLLPTISILIGRLLFDSVENPLHRALFGGLTFVTVKGLLKIYLMDRQCTRRRKRRVVDYTEENMQTYRNNSNNTSNGQRTLLENSSLQMLHDL